MRKTVVFLLLSLLLVGGNIYRFDIVEAHSTLNCSQQHDEVAAKEHQHFISESGNWLSNTDGKNNISCRIITAVRQLPTNTPFKELYTKQIIKSKLITRETVFNSCFSQRQQNGFYTHGIGYLRI